MQISTKSRYGLRAMVEIALHYQEGPLALREIAEKQEISFKYLEQIMPHLKSAGLVRSIQGAGGGYELCRSPEDITALEILRALEGPLAPVNCVNQPEVCERLEGCVTRDIWVEIADLVEGFLDSKSLGQLARREEELR